MIVMIAVSWAVSTVISIPPLFGLKDPVIDEDRLQNFSDHFRRSRALPDAVGGSFNPTANAWVNETLCATVCLE